MNYQGRKYGRAIRHTLCAVSIALILAVILINPCEAISPGIGGGAPRSVGSSTLPAAGEYAPTGTLCYLDVEAPMPYLRCGNPANHFEALRQVVIDGAGFDFLARCGDLMRPRN